MPPDLKFIFEPLFGPDQFRVRVDFADIEARMPLAVVSGEDDLRFDPALLVDF